MLGEHFHNFACFSEYFIRRQLGIGQVGGFFAPK